MITGFNTDIEYQGVTYHVQTEDKGLKTPLILSLVYNRGTVLASKRSPYDDLLGNFDEEILAERLQKQHKLICAAIRGGRIEDLKRMSMRESVSKKKGLTAQKEVKFQPPPPPKLLQSVPEKVSVKEKIPVKKAEIPIPQILNGANERFEEIRQPEASPPFEVRKESKIEAKTELPISKPNEIWNAPINITDADLIFDEVETVEEITILSAEAVEIITDFTTTDTPAADTLALELLSDAVFKSGQSKTISVLVSRGTDKNILMGASVMVKIIGSHFRPLIFHAKTDSNGVAIIQLHLPQFSRGRGAVLVKAMSGSDEAELRRIVQPD